MKHTSLAEYRARRDGNRITAALARRLEAAWQRYEVVRASAGITAALSALRRWEWLRQALACHIAGQPAVVVVPADPQPLAIAHRPAPRTTLPSSIPEVLARRFAAAGRCRPPSRRIRRVMHPGRIPLLPPALSTPHRDP